MLYIRLLFSANYVQLISKNKLKKIPGNLNPLVNPKPGVQRSKILF